MVRIGVAGCGQIAQVRHLPEYAANGDCQIVSVYDKDVKCANEQANKYGCKAYWEDFEAFLASGIDAVSVCVPNALHYAFAERCLRAGKHVLCEKPLAVTLEECEGLVRAAEETGKTLMVGQNQRYNAAHQLARELIRAGEIGDIVGFALTFGHSGPEKWVGRQDPWFFYRDKAQYGSIMDLGVHKIDLLRYLTGLEAEEVSALIATVDKKFSNGAPIEVDDNAIYLLRMTNGAIGTVKASWTFYAGEDNSTRIYGTKGCLRIFDDPDHSVVVAKSDGSVIERDLERMSTNAEQFRGAARSTGVVDAFVQAILEGKQPHSNGADVLKSMRVMFAGVQAAQTKRAVRMADFTGVAKHDS